MKNKIISLLIISFITILSFTTVVQAANIGDKLSFLKGNGLLGDVNGDKKITEKDAELVLQYTTRKKYLILFQQKRADVDQDKKVTSFDALAITKYVKAQNTVPQPEKPQEPVRPTVPVIPEVKVTGLTISGSDNLNLGQTLQLTATVTPINAKNKTVTWTSSNNNIATVNSSGKVTAVNTGSVTITAKAGDITKTKTIYVGSLYYNTAVTISNPKTKCPSTLYVNGNNCWVMSFGCSPNYSTVYMNNNSSYKCSGAVALYYANRILGNAVSTSVITSDYVDDENEYMTNFPGGNYKYKTETSYANEIKIIYDELMKGNPVPLAVRNAKGEALYVLAYAIKENAAINGKVTASDIAVLDTKDGKSRNLGSYYQYTIEKKATYTIATYNQSEEYTYKFGNVNYKTAIKKSKIDSVISKIQNKGCHQSYMGGNCFKIAIYHTKLLLGIESESNASISRVSQISTTFKEQIFKYNRTDYCKMVKSKIDSKKPVVIYVYSGKAQHYVTAVGYTGNGDSLDDFLILGSWTGKLLKGTTGEAEYIKYYDDSQGEGYRALLFN